MLPRERASELLAKLLSLTPELESGLDAGEVAMQAEAFMEERAPIFGELKRLLQKEPGALRGDLQSRRIRDELGERDARWSAALSSARSALSSRRQAAQRARRAQRAYAR